MLLVFLTSLCFSSVICAQERNQSDRYDRNDSHRGASDSRDRYSHPDSHSSTMNPRSDDRRHRPVIDHHAPSYKQGNYYYPSKGDNKPFHYGHWVFDRAPSNNCRRSLYFYYGRLPYVDTVRVRIGSSVVISYTNRTYRYHGGDGYYLSRDGDRVFDKALYDIRDAWVSGRFDLVRDHVIGSQMISVLLDGSYDYSLSSSDYIDMTQDAIEQTRTISFTWEIIRQRANGDYTAFGKHIYRDDNNVLKNVYVSYTLTRIGSRYGIIEVGSSTSPLSY